jgi:hypothetical protein
MGGKDRVAIIKSFIYVKVRSGADGGG